MKAKITLCTNEHNKKIACIKFYRWLTGGGLKDSKDAIEKLQTQFGDNPAEFTVETEFSAVDIEAYMNECKIGGSAIVGNGIEGKFFGMDDGVIRLQVSFGKNKMEMDLPLSNLGTMIDGFLVNAQAAKDMETAPDEE